MRSTISLPASLAAAITLACNTGVYAHTWVEQLRLIASNGSFVGNPGYIRNLVPRIGGGDPDANTFLLPPNGGGNAFLPTNLMCRSAQVKPQQTANYPRLTAAPGDHVALQYLENGHVTLFNQLPGKPAGRGTIFVYATKDSRETDTYLGIHRVWNTEGSGGDQRGKLIATRQFDDGRCAQNNALPVARARLAALGTESEVWCQNDIKIPDDAGTSGSYTLYWVWEWPTLDINGAVTKNESYTSCMDINMTPNTVASAGKFAAQKVVGPEANAVAIEAQMSGEQFLVDPTALPSLTSDNLPTGTPTGKPTPGGGAAAPPGPPAITPSSKAPQSASQTIRPTSTSPPAQGFKTVTVTAKEIETVYVTGAPSSSASSSPSTSSVSNTKTKTVIVVTSTVTVRQPGTTPSASAPRGDNTAFTSPTALPTSSVLPTAFPTPSPFLTPDNQIQRAGADHAGAESATSTSSSCPTPVARRRRSRIEGRSSESELSQRWRVPAE